MWMFVNENCIVKIKFEYNAYIIQQDIKGFIHKIFSYKILHMKDFSGQQRNNDNN